ncbi:hypothetical protein [Pseudodonghicola flavimaris]|uniref:Lipoprotein n=1 Tax=Pseudodonghicola flavimaris TaxID=3050036 RepID=A0ABT7F5H8_9RHOB|nr:hypothetical protein [Pseudodonghicola flavimaris]MDK3019856.1 hypothetical protein [Pseudodonghicola flavimaris]
MKTGLALIVVTLALAGCGQRYAEAWYQRKAQCAGGDYTACSEIGHQARAAMGGPSVSPAASAVPMPLSTPIID